MTTTELIMALQADPSPLHDEVIAHLEQLQLAFMEELLDHMRLYNRVQEALAVLTQVRTWAIEHRSAKFRVHVHDIERALLGQ